MNSSTALLQRIAEDSTSQIASSYFKEMHDTVGTVTVRSTEEIIEDFWHVWQQLIPPRLSIDDMQAILTERPELPADQDPSTREFLRPAE